MINEMLVTTIEPADAAKLLSGCTSDGTNTMLLTGAGVSMLSPTNLPSGPALLDAAMRAVVTEEDLVRQLPRERGMPDWDRVVPETMFQVITDAAGEFPWPILDPLIQAHPNQLHRWLASVNDSPTVTAVTTNFDLLQDRTDRAPLHLHGSLLAPEMLVATIRAVGRGLRSDIESIFRDRLEWCQRLVVLGCSGNDRDVMQPVEAAPPDEVIWFVRSRDDLALRNLETLGSSTTLRVLATDLEALQEHLASQPLGTTTRTLEIKTATPLPRARRALQVEIVVGALLLMDQFDASIALLGKELRVISGRAGQDGQDFATLSVLLSHAYNRIGGQAKALAVASRARAMHGLTPVLQFQLATQCGLAALDADPTDLRTAREALETAAELAKQFRGPEARFLARATHNLGYLEMEAFLQARAGDLEAAARLYLDAVALKREQGDTPSLQHSLRNAAAVLRVLGRDGQADLLEQEFFGIAERYSYRWSRAYYSALLSCLWSAVGRIDLSVIEQAAAETMYRDVGDESSAALLAEEVARAADPLAS